MSTIVDQHLTLAVQARYQALDRFYRAVKDREDAERIIAAVDTTVSNIEAIQKKTAQEQTPA